MVKPTQVAADKYAAKYDPTVVSARMTANKAAATLLQASHANALQVKALAVRGILNTAGVMPLRSVQFIGFSNKLYGICNKFSGATAVGKATNVAYAWLQDMGYLPVAGVFTVIPPVAPQIYNDFVILGQVWSLYTATLGSVPSPLHT